MEIDDVASTDVERQAVVESSCFHTGSVEFADAKFAVSRRRSRWRENHLDQRGTRAEMLVRGMVRGRVVGATGSVWESGNSQGFERSCTQDATPRAFSHTHPMRRSICIFSTVICVHLFFRVSERLGVADLLRLGRITAL